MRCELNRIVHISIFTIHGKDKDKDKAFSWQSILCFGQFQDHSTMEYKLQKKWKRVTRPQLKDGESIKFFVLPIWGRLWLHCHASPCDARPVIVHESGVSAMEWWAWKWEHVDELVWIWELFLQHNCVAEDVGDDHQSISHLFHIESSYCIMFHRFPFWLIQNKNSRHPVLIYVDRIEQVDAQQTLFGRLQDQQWWPAHNTISFHPTTLLRSSEASILPKWDINFSATPCNYKSCLSMAITRYKQHMKYKI